MERDPVDKMPLLDGLASLPPDGFENPQSAEGFQDALFARTVRVIRSRSQWKRVRLAVALVAVYIAGFGTSQFLGVKAVEAPAAVTVESTVVSRVHVPADPVAVLRRVHTTSFAERPGLLKQAGDEYLLASGDLEGALHCYRQFLEIASDDERTRPEPGDTWLLASLKQGQTTNRMR